MFWNTSGTGTLRSLQYATGYVIGTAPELTVATDPAQAFGSAGAGTDPVDWTEGLGQADLLDPPSLYEAQLA
ncbi:MAG: hypothetical protein ABGY75_04575, partial [Gemmataceae bacterium]